MTDEAETRRLQIEAHTLINRNDWDELRRRGPEFVNKYVCNDFIVSPEQARGLVRAGFDINAEHPNLDGTHSTYFESAHSYIDKTKNHIRTSQQEAEERAESTSVFGVRPLTRSSRVSSKSIDDKRKMAENEMGTFGKEFGLYSKGETVLALYQEGIKQGQTPTEETKREISQIGKSIKDFEPYAHQPKELDFSAVEQPVTQGGLGTLRQTLSANAQKMSDDPTMSHQTVNTGR